MQKINPFVYWCFWKPFFWSRDAVVVGSSVIAEILLPFVSKTYVRFESHKMQAVQDSLWKHLKYASRFSKYSKICFLMNVSAIEGRSLSEIIWRNLFLYTCWINGQDVRPVIFQTYIYHCRGLKRVWWHRSHEVFIKVSIA